MQKPFRRTRTDQRKIAVPPASVPPDESARNAGLRYVSDSTPGISRRHSGMGFVYIGVDGKPIHDKEVISRIKSLVIPPAWKNLWICPLANGHLQATGRDARARKQYRYHPQYRAVRDLTKFNRMIAFGNALPRIRQQVEADLHPRGLSKRKVAATVVRLLETTCMRVGNEEYAKQNNSFGLTTLRNRHVRIRGDKLRFDFRGKSGQQQNIELNDPRLARIVQRLHDLPGYDLFEYIDEEGRPVKITSEDVNEYLREISGEDFTAKDFRTWMGTRLALLALESLGIARTKAASKRNVVAAIKAAAQMLGNRPAACRKYYVHPAILDAYGNGTLCAALKRLKAGRITTALCREEQCVMSLLKNQEETPAESARHRQR